MNSTEISVTTILLFLIACSIGTICCLFNSPEEEEQPYIPRVTFQVDGVPINAADENTTYNAIEVVAYKNNMIHEPITVNINIVDDDAESKL